MLEKNERTQEYEGGLRSNNLPANERGPSPMNRTPQLSSDDLEQLAKEINICPTCSPKKTKPPQNPFDKLQGDLPPSIIVESAASGKQDEEKLEEGGVAGNQDEESDRPKMSLNPFYEENSMSRDISQATSLETAQVSMLPQQGSGQNSEISDSWENLEESDLQPESLEDGKVNFSIGEEDTPGATGDGDTLDADREALYNKYKPVQYNTM